MKAPRYFVWVCSAWGVDGWRGDHFTWVVMSGDQVAGGGEFSLCHASRALNGLLKGTNSLIQAAKTRARGYRNKRKMITITYLVAGKLDLPTITNSCPV